VHAGRVLTQGPIAEVAGTTEPGFGVQLGDNGPQVREALAAAGLRTRAAGDDLLVQGSSDLVRDVAAERGWPLRRLVPQAPSLEETFLRLQAAQAAPAAPAAPTPATPEAAAWGAPR
jgi:hypothetical protein